MAETPAPRDFRMHGARAAMAAGLSHIEQQINGIEAAIENNPGLTFDLAKTLIESTCKTILSERNVAYDPSDDLPKLFKITTNHLPFLPVAASGEAGIRNSLARTLGGLRTAVQGVCELRNACGFASHGADGPRPALETVQALLAAETADAVVGFLYRIHTQDRTPPGSPRLNYDDHSDFNEYVDELHDRARVFEEDFEPSKILFGLAPEAYRLYLAEYAPEPDAAEPAPVVLAATVPVP